VSDLARFLAVVLVGVGTGILSGMFGVGGAIISTPAVRALGATPLEAVGSTLPSIIPSSISGTWRYHRDGLVQWHVVVWTASFGVFAAVGGALLTDVIPGDGHPLMLATAALVAFTAYRLGRPVPTVELAVDGTRPGGPDVAPPTQLPTQLPTQPGPQPVRTERWRLGVVGVAAGGLSGLLGIGGGILMVPAFVSWIRLPLKAAIATSLACVGILAIPGTITHAYLGHIDWYYALPLCIGVVPGAQIGAHLAIRSSDRALRVSVATVLGTISVIYGISELRALF
jgi:uncharacterized membrane protein YfcA